MSHPEVTAAYERWQSNQAGGQPGDFLRAGMARRSFVYASIMFEEYRGKVGATDFVAPDKAHFYPVGVPGLFVTRFGPADFVEAVNTLGLPRYAKAAPDMRFQRFVDLHMQTNPLNMCTRPRTPRAGPRWRLSHPCRPSPTPWRRFSPTPTWPSTGPTCRRPAGRCRWRVIWSRPDDTEQIFQTGTNTTRRVAEIPAAEVAQPVEGDSIQIPTGGSTYKVVAGPRQPDPDRHVWRLELGPPG